MPSPPTLFAVSLLGLSLLCGPAVAQRPLLTKGVAPLPRPSAPGALRGAAVCLERLDDRLLTGRATIYLQRLLAAAGAHVAYDRSGTHADEPELAVASRAHVLLELGSTPGEGSVHSIAIPDGDRGERTELERALSRRVGEKLGECARHETGAGPVVKLSLRVSAGTEHDLAHRAPVHALFEAVVDWWRANRTRIAALHRKIHGSARTVRAAARPFHRRFWPLSRPPRTEVEAAAMIQAWRKGYLVDATQVHLDVRVDRTADGWSLDGSTELPLLARATRAFLESAGVRPLSGALRILPDERAEDPWFGIVTARSAQTWSRPGRASGSARVDRPGQGEETEVLRGEPVRILDRQGQHLLVHAASGYLGWVSAAAVRRCSAKEFASALDAESTGSEAGVRVARAALKRMGTPYLFGGRGREGIDCSGLVQTSWEEQGVFLPRDSRMQLLTGKLVATARQPAPLRPGDLLFFTNGRGRISHVAISLGGHRFVHATPPEVTVGSLDPEDPWYTSTATRFCLAKRVAR